MDEKDKQKFVEIKEIHDCAERNGASERHQISNGVERHHHRGELLGIVDRLLASTAHDAATLQRYKRFGRLDGGFFGEILTLDAERSNNVFVRYNGVQWRVSGLMQANDRLAAENKDLKAKIEGQNGLKERNDRQAATIKEQIAENERLRQENGSLKAQGIDGQRRINGLTATLDERNETIKALRNNSDHMVNAINRKDALLVEKDKEIKQLKSFVQNSVDRWLPPPVFTSSAIQMQAQAEIGKLKSALRSTQEEVGELRIELADALEHVEELRDRLGHIGAIACGDEDVPDDTIDEPEGEAVGDFGTMYAVDIEIGPGVWGFMHKPAKKE